MKQIKKIIPVMIPAIIAFQLFAKVNAQVVYTDVNPDSTIFNSIFYYEIDINSDGVDDFVIRRAFSNDAGFYFTDTLNNKVIYMNAKIAAMDINQIIDAQQTWSSPQYDNELCSSGNPNFAGKGDKYIGLRIKKNNSFYYGWIRINISSDDSKVVIKDYAYNQTANASITTGKETTGVNEWLGEVTNATTVYPNPFNVSTTIQFNTKTTNAQLTIYNVVGQNVKTIKQITTNTVKIERDDLTAGIYFYELEQNSKTLSTGKLIITD